MTEKISLEDIEINKILPRDDVSLFNCGDEDLNEFIQNDALLQMQAKMNVTYLCRDKNNGKEPIGFLTISNDSIKIRNADKKRLGISYPAYPAIKIGRLATDKKYQRKNIGSYLIMWVIGLALEQCQKLGVRFISVDAYGDEEIQKFYIKNQFVQLDKSKDGNIPMYSDINSW